MTTSLAVVALAAALVFRRPMAVPAAIVLLASPYVAIVALEAESIDTAAPALAGGLYLVAELAYWSLELRGHISDEPGTYLRRASVLAGLVLLTIALGTGVLGLVQVVAARGAAVDVLGAVAAVGAIALLALAAARRTSYLASGSGGCIDTPGTGRGLGFGTGFRSVSPSAGASGSAGTSSGKTDSGASPASSRSN